MIKVSKLLTEFPLAGPTVDGLRVTDHVPNMGSIRATLDSYHIDKGVRVVPMFDLSAPYYANVSENDRVRRLAEQIKENQYIDPLIVVEDSEGLYVLEGGHRISALHLLGVQHFPAIVVHEDEDA